MANPTTNYGFVLPTSTDLVTDLPADFDVALQGVDTRLKALQPGTTLGDIAYSSATANTNTRLGIGSTGNVLTVAGGVPTWAAPAAGGGKVLQVVQATTSTRVDITSTTYTDSGLTASITPTLNTSKILVMVSQHARSGRSANENGSMAKIVRGATDIWNAPTTPTLNTYAAGATATQITAFQTFIYLDSPATTSSTTYKTQWKVETTANSGEISLQVGSNVSTITLMEIGA
jgi:hypothetical protein